MAACVLLGKFWRAPRCGSLKLKHEKQKLPPRLRDLREF